MIVYLLMQNILLYTHWTCNKIRFFILFYLHRLLNFHLGGWHWRDLFFCSFILLLNGMIPKHFEESHLRMPPICSNYFPTHLLHFPSHLLLLLATLLLNLMPLLLSYQHLMCLAYHWLEGFPCTMLTHDGL